MFIKKFYPNFTPIIFPIKNVGICHYTRMYDCSHKKEEERMYDCKR